MSDLADRIAGLSGEARALLARRLGPSAPAGASPFPPIAVLAVGCRFPGGAESPEAFWRTLLDGVDGVVEVPTDRWDAAAYYDPDPSRPGRSTSRWGGFLGRVDGFDAGFFGLTPREATQMDPQQRVLLEVAWEALEDSGQLTSQLAGGAAGVFMGAVNHNSDYYYFQARDPAIIDTYTCTGTAHSILSNRLSYILDLRGPSLTIDTACSSSLVAVHLACQGLRLGECDLAVAGGVNLMLAPETGIVLSKLELMAADGRCKTFDHRADGFVRGEGCGVVVLKRLDDAVRDGDPILAVILGSATNQDGATNGLTAPSGLAQQAVIRRALQAAGVEPSRIGYVETHGTGTALGDPIEVESLGEVLTPGREPPVRRCVLGALKTNIGHLEAAAGIAGLIKAVLCLCRGAIPPNLHFQEPNPHLALEGSPFSLPLDVVPWPRDDEPRFAGVSSFGFGGTNAHVILTESPDIAGPVEGPADDRPYLLVLSARSPEALRDLARSYIAFLEEATARHSSSVRDIAYTASVRRLHHEHRAAVVGRTARDWADALRRFIEAPDEAQADREAVETADRRGDGRTMMLKAEAARYLAGEPVDWRRQDSGRGRCIELPRYPWQRRRYWVGAPPGSPIAASASDDWYYDLRWELRARFELDSTRPEPAGLPAPETLVASLRPRVEAVEADCGLDRLGGARSRLDRLSIAYIVDAFARMGMTFHPGTALGSCELAARLGVLPRHQRLLESLLGMLADDGSLRRDDEGWCFIRPPVAIDVPREVARLADDYPSLGALIGLLDRCGTRLADVLTGKCDPLSLLFPEDKDHSAEAIYRSAPPLRAMNLLAGEAVAALVAARAPGRTFRVLEIGAGTGGTSASILPCLPPDRCEYVFSDISSQLLREAEGRFREYPFVRYRLLNIEEAPQSQGFGAGNFDLIVAANVLHATADLGESLANIRQLLAPGGLLLLLEVSSARRWGDLTFGLTEGWWRFRDTWRRGSHPLLGPGVWTALLRETGFLETATVSLQDGPDCLLDQALIVARNAAAPHPVTSSTDLPAREVGCWLILADEQGVGRALADRLEARGDACILVGRGASFWRRDGARYQIDPVVAADYARLLGETLDPGRPSLTAVVYLWGLDADLAEDGRDLGRAEDLASGSALLLARSMLAEGRAPERGLWLVTRGAVPLGPGPSASGVAQSPLWGFGRAVAVERPELGCGLIDLGPMASPIEDAAALLVEIDRSDGEEQVALRGADRYVPRQVRVDRPADPGPSTGAVASPRIRGGGTYLITGGLGRVGLELAGWLADRGARHVTLLSRRPLHAASGGEGRGAAVRAIEDRGATVAVVSGDVGDAEYVTRLFARFGGDLPPLRGLFHAAVAYDAVPLEGLELAAMAAMMRTKAAGAWHLHQLTRGLDLECFVLFSSMAAVWGAAGQVHYAAANALLDALAHHRRTLDLPALSVNWGFWEQAGISPTGVGREFTRVGLRPMAPALALEAIGRLLGAGVTQRGVAAIDWSVLKPAYEAKRRRPLLERVGAGSQYTPAATGSPGQRLIDAPIHQRRDLIESLVQSRVAGVLGLDPAEPIDRRRGFFEMGMDSLTVVQLRRRLEADMQHPLPSTLAFNYPTVESLTAYLFRALGGEVDRCDEGPAPVPPIEDITVGPAEIADDESEEELLGQLAVRLKALR